MSQRKIFIAFVKWVLIVSLALAANQNIGQVIAVSPTKFEKRNGTSIGLTTSNGLSLGAPILPTKPSVDVQEKDLNIEGSIDNGKNDSPIPTTTKSDGSVVSSVVQILPVDNTPSVPSILPTSELPIPTKQKDKSGQDQSNDAPIANTLNSAPTSQIATKPSSGGITILQPNPNDGSSGTQSNGDSSATTASNSQPDTSNSQPDTSNSQPDTSNSQSDSSNSQTGSSNSQTGSGTSKPTKNLPNIFSPSALGKNSSDTTNNPAAQIITSALGGDPNDSDNPNAAPGDIDNGSVGSGNPSNSKLSNSIDSGSKNAQNIGIAPTFSPPKGSNDGSLTKSSPNVVAIVVGSIAAVGACIGALATFRWYKKRKGNYYEDEESEGTEFERDIMSSPNADTRQISLGPDPMIGHPVSPENGNQVTPTNSNAYFSGNYGKPIPPVPSIPSVYSSQIPVSTMLPVTNLYLDENNQAAGPSSSAPEVMGWRGSSQLFS